MDDIDVLTPLERHPGPLGLQGIPQARIRRRCRRGSLKG
jgi:hypothetical protein